jgi:hypothetical protein
MLNIHKGQKLSVVVMDDTIELVPERDIKELKGAFPHISSDDVRDEGDRL